MARMISIKLDGQISSDKDGRVHMGVGMGTIWGDCGTKVGVFVCHSVVGLSVIEADDSCPRAGCRQGRIQTLLPLPSIGL